MGRRSCRSPPTSGSAGTTASGILGALGFQVAWIVVLLGCCQLGAARRDPQGGGPGWLTAACAVRPRHVGMYAAIAGLWVRAAWVYRTSFITLVVANGLITGLDAVAIWVMFSQLDLLGGFALHEVALLYGASSLGLGIADTLIGSVERIGEYIRTGRLDQMLTKPLPLLLQVCADQFTLRRLGRITQAPSCSPGRRRTSTGRRAGRRRGDDGRLRRGDLLRAVRGVLVHPVLDQGRHRVRQRVHLRRRDADAVPAHDLPAGADARR